MAEVFFNLQNKASLKPLVPPVRGRGYGAARLPNGLSGSGMYVIHNREIDNWYVGTSGNLSQRFNKRMEVITEMGFSSRRMDQIDAYWGDVSYKSTAPPNHPLPIVFSTPLADYQPPLDVIIDGFHFDLEFLLIRFVMTQLNLGGTVSNNVGMGQLTNPTTNIISTQVRLGTRIFNSNWNPGQIW